MDKQQKDIEKKAMQNYPDGEVAKSKFLAEFYKKPDISEQGILADMKDYTTRFKDTSAQMKYTFYITMIDYLLGKNYWQRLPLYEQLMNDKLTLASLYNSSASHLCGEQLNKQGEQMLFAKMLAKKALNYVADTLRKIAPDDNTEYLQSTFNDYADTYALILYKLGQYDSAFYYQNNIYKQGKEMDVAALERYSVYAEKVKGLKFAEAVIEKELLGGINSPTMLEQLKSIYKKMGIPEDEFDKLSEKTAILARQKTAKLIKSQFGTIKAPDFTLKNIQGKNVSLSSLKNKVIVLDFWATWCGPCRASFPAMQELIDKYKKDTTVFFLFIDVWEKNDPEKTRETVTKFIKDNSYSFNILFDTQDKVVNDYKIEYIPAKFVIDKKGNMVFMGNEVNDLSLIINDEKNKEP
ncbi:MAG: TlpA family protein disulfide reductase [Bacteroidota bacterium]|nr:TlpA family protein disulfide reductase [Bacteroidota bacterium]